MTLPKSFSSGSVSTPVTPMAAYWAWVASAMLLALLLYEVLLALLRMAW